MDAVKYLKEKKRMCEQFVECDPCPIYTKWIEPEYGIYSCDQFVDCYPELAVSIVEKWSKEHPIMTNRQKMIEVFGINGLDSADVRPSWLDAEYKEPKGEK